MTRSLLLAAAIGLALPGYTARALACLPHAGEPKAGLCGFAPETQFAHDVAGDCGEGQETACAGRLQRLGEAALLIGRYTALGRAELASYTSRR